MFLFSIFFLFFQQINFKQTVGVLKILCYELWFSYVKLKIGRTCLLKKYQYHSVSLSLFIINPCQLIFVTKQKSAVTWKNVKCENVIRSFAKSLPTVCGDARKMEVVFLHRQAIQNVYRINNVFNFFFSRRQILIFQRTHCVIHCKKWTQSIACKNRIQYRVHFFRYRKNWYWIRNNENWYSSLQWYCKE